MTSVAVIVPEIFTFTINKTIFQAVLPNCLAYLVPILADCNEISDMYKENGIEMNRILQRTFGDLKEILKEKFFTVTENLLSNLWDYKVFKDLFNMDIDYEAECHNININVFTTSLEYLQVRLIM